MNEWTGAAFFGGSGKASFNFFLKVIVQVIYFTGSTDFKWMGLKELLLPFCSQVIEKLLHVNGLYTYFYPEAATSMLVNGIIWYSREWEVNGSHVTSKLHLGGAEIMLHKESQFVTCFHFYAKRSNTINYILN